MAAAEHMRITRSVESKVMGIDDKVTGVEEGVQDVRCEVEDVGKRVQGVDDKVEGVGKMVQDIDQRVQGVGERVKDKVQDVGDNVQDVNHKLDEANRPSSPTAHHSDFLNISQETCFEIACYDGFLLRILPSIIILRPNFITTAHLNGSFKGVLSSNGRPLSPSCGYTENVRSSSTLSLPHRNS